MAGGHLEDQVFPKKCGFFEGKLVIPVGWKDVIYRCRAYRDAGADLVFVDGIRTVEDMNTYATTLRDLPTLYNGMLVSVPEVERKGFALLRTSELRSIWSPVHAS